jgi:hypothetical protein
LWRWRGPSSGFTTASDSKYGCTAVVTAIDNGIGTGFSGGGGVVISGGGGVVIIAIAVAVESCEQIICHRLGSLGFLAVYNAPLR